MAGRQAIFIRKSILSYQLYLMAPHAFGNVATPAGLKVRASHPWVPVVHLFFSQDSLLSSHRLSSFPPRPCHLQELNDYLLTRSYIDG